MRSHLSIASLNFWPNRALFRKPISTPESCRVVRIFSSSTLCFRFYIEVFDPMELFLCSIIDIVSCSYFYMWTPSVYSIVENAFLHPVDDFGIIAEQQMVVVPCTHVCIFSAVPLVCMAVLCQYHTVSVTANFASLFISLSLLLTLWIEFLGSTVGINCIPRYVFLRVGLMGESKLTQR